MDELRIRLDGLLNSITSAGRMPTDLAVLGRLRTIIGDIVDALRTAPKRNVESLVRQFDRGLRQWGPQPTPYMIADGLADLEQFDRVKHVLLALSVISEPVASGMVAELVQKELDAPSGAILDPLVVLAVGLQRRDIGELDLRAAAVAAKSATQMGIRTM